jgi:hypothetical protein
MSTQTAPHEAIEKAAGLAVSGIVRVTNLFVNQAGPLPKTRAFTSSGGTLAIFVSGSLSTGNPARLLVMNIDFDGIRIGTCQEWINVNSHISLVPVLLSVPTPAAGNHVIALSVGSGDTSTDQNDYYNVTVIELGK